MLLGGSVLWSMRIARPKCFLQTMSALQYSQTVGCSPATCAAATECYCGESAAGASLAGHRRGCARCCCCDGTGAAAFGIGGPLLVAGCGSLAVAGDLAGVVEHVDWFDEVFCVKDLSSLALHSFLAVIVLQALLWQAVGTVGIWHPLWRLEAAVKLFFFWQHSRANDQFTDLLYNFL